MIPRNDTRRNTPRIYESKSLLPKRQRQQLRPRPTPSRQLISGNISHSGRELSGPIKPRVVTIVLPTPIRPYKRISLLLNKRSAANLEQLLLDVTEAFQIPRWHNDHVRRLYTLREGFPCAIIFWRIQGKLWLKRQNYKIIEWNISRGWSRFYCHGPWWDNAANYNTCSRRWANLTLKTFW